MSGRANNVAFVRAFFRVMIAWTVLAPAAAMSVAQEVVEPKTPTCAAHYLGHTATVDGFVFKTYWNVENEDGCLEVSRNGGIVFRESSKGGEYTLGQPRNRKYGVPKVANGTDLTGRGHPDMIVSNWSGGAHCCFTRYLFELEPVFKLLATFDDADAEFGHFVDLDQNQHYYYLADDWTFAYWPGCFACSPSAPITLQFVEDGKGGSYHLALDKMHQPEPTPTEWGKSLQETRKTFSEPNWELFIGTTLWDTELKLIYAGHPDLAWKFLDEAWPAKAKGKSEWLGDFCSRLKTSPYWPDLEPVVRGAPSACTNAKPGPGER
jgi:hypothetical protein